MSGYTDACPDKLLPCPLCGAEPRAWCDDYINGRIIMAPDYYVECDPCGIRVTVEDNGDLTWILWNRMAAKVSP